MQAQKFRSLTSLDSGEDETMVSVGTSTVVDTSVLY